MGAANLPRIDNLLAVNSFVAHHGVKGMHWGVRRANPSSSSTSTTPKHDKKAPSEDAKTASAAKKKVKAGGVKTLSNKELQDLVTRMNLEQQLHKLQNGPDRIKSGNDKLKQVLAVGKTANEAHNFLKSPMGKFVKKGFMMGAAAAAAAAKGKTRGPSYTAYAIRQLVNK